MELYKIKLRKVYVFELNGSDEDNIIEQVNHIVKNTVILENVDDVKRTTKMKIKKITKKKSKNL